MGADLSVDELEAALGVGNVLAETGGELGEQVAVFAGGGFGVQVQLGDLAGEQRLPLGIEGGDVALGVLNLACDSEQLGGRAFAGDGGVDFAVIIKQTLQGFCIAAAVGLICASHQQSEVLLLRVIACEVGVNALSDITKESFEAGWWIELFGLTRLAECGIVGLLRALAGLLCSAPGGVGVVEVDFALSDACFEIVEFCVKDADLPKVTAFKSFELGSDLGKLGFALGEHRSDAGKLLALVEERVVVRSLLEDDFGWHSASLRKALV